MLVSNQVRDVPVFAALIPREGPKAVPVPFDFTAYNSQVVDLSNLQQRGLISAVQAVFADNSANPVALVISVNGSQQNIIVPPNSQGYFPLLVPAAIELTVSMTGATSPGTTIFLLNFPVPAVQWAISGNQNTYNAGALVVSDAALDACVSGSQLLVNGNVTGDGGNNYPAWIANSAKTGGIAASAAAIITGNPGYFIRSLSLSLSPGATIAVAGDLIATLHDSVTGDIAQFVFSVPSGAPTLAAASAIHQTSAPDFLWNNKAANSNLSLNLSAALTAGKLYYNVGYGLTAVVG